MGRGQKLPLSTGYIFCVCVSRVEDTDISEEEEEEMAIVIDSHLGKLGIFKKKEEEPLGNPVVVTDTHIPPLYITTSDRSGICHRQR